MSRVDILKKVVAYTCTVYLYFRNSVICADAMGALFNNSSSGAGLASGGWLDPLRVQMVTAHHNCIAVVYPHFVACFKQRENNGFQHLFSTPYLDHLVERVAINAKMGSVLPPSTTGEQVGTYQDWFDDLYRNNF
jgi:hypothetical protein